MFKKIALLSLALVSSSIFTEGKTHPAKRVMKGTAKGLHRIVTAPVVVARHLVKKDDCEKSGCEKRKMKHRRCGSCSK